MAIKGYLISKTKGKRPLIIIGKTNTPHGRELVEKYRKEESIVFVGGIYDYSKLNSIRHFAFAYFHGHSVGGTNPSLLEAMASGCFILANNNIFNKAVLKENSIYYSSAEEVAEVLNLIDFLAEKYKATYVNNNLCEIRQEYSWEKLVDEHESYFRWLISQKKKD